MLLLQLDHSLGKVAPAIMSEQSTTPQNSISFKLILSADLDNLELMLRQTISPVCVLISKDCLYQGWLPLDSLVLVRWNEASFYSVCSCVFLTVVSFCAWTRQQRIHKIWVLLTFAFCVRSSTHHKELQAHGTRRHCEPCHSKKVSFSGGLGRAR